MGSLRGELVAPSMFSLALEASGLHGAEKGRLGGSPLLCLDTGYDARTFLHLVSMVVLLLPVAAPLGRHCS